MRTKDQLKQVVERALYEPNSKAFLKREMQIAKEKYYYEHEDFLNDSLMNISEIAQVKHLDLIYKETKLN